MHCFRAEILAGILLGILLIFAAGCAKVSPDQQYETAAAEISTATGSSSVFQPSEEEPGKVKVEELLRGGITLKEAVQICLLNNPVLQAAFFDVGIAEADVVQSGLFSNPTLGLSLQFPESGGRSNFQAGIAQNIVDFWQIPVRKAIAGRARQQAIYNVVQQAVTIVGDTKIAYFTAVGSRQALAISEENVALARKLLDTAQARRDAGAVGELDVNLAKSTVISAEIEVQKSRLDARLSENRLAQLLGMDRHGEEWVLSTPLPPQPDSIPNEDSIAELAIVTRLDLKVADQEVERAAARVRQEILNVFPNIDMGVALERNEQRSLTDRDILADTARASIAGGQLTVPEIQSQDVREAERDQEINYILGPTLGMTLPIFDQNQAQIAKAQYVLEQAIKEREALRLEIVQQARRASLKAETDWAIARSFGEELLPRARENLDMSDESYRAGRAAVIVVLEAQRVLLEARRGHIVALQSAAISIADMERVAARPMAEILSFVSGRGGLPPTSAPRDEVEE